MEAEVDATADVGAGVSLDLALARAAAALGERIEAVVRINDLSLGEWRVLRCLVETGGGHPMAHLAQRTGMTGPTLTRVVDALTTSALVFRDVDPHDRRRVLAHASDRGRACYRRVIDEVVRVEAAATSALTASEVATLRSLLERSVRRDRPGTTPGVTR